MVKEKLITTKAYPQLEKRIKEIKACWEERDATTKSVLKLKDKLENTLHFIEANRGNFNDFVIEITGSSCIQSVLEYLRYSTTHIYIIEALLSNSN